MTVDGGRLPLHYRLQFRAFLYRAVPRLEGRERAAVRRVLESASAFSQVIDGVAGEYCAYTQAEAASDHPRIAAFFEWLVEHMDDIVRFILTIVLLFVAPDLKSEDSADA